MSSERVERMKWPHITHHMQNVFTRSNCSMRGAATDRGVFVLTAVGDDVWEGIAFLFVKNPGGQDGPGLRSAKLPNTAQTAGRLRLKSAGTRLQERHRPGMIKGNSVLPDGSSPVYHCLSRWILVLRELKHFSFGLVLVLV